MKLKLLFCVLILTAFSFAQESPYPLVTIQDIQMVPDSLLGTDPPSPLNGDTVRVRGLVMVRPVIDSDTNRRVIISAGARWVTYIQDPENPEWGGLNVLQEDTSSGPQVYNTNFDLIDTAQVVEFTGIVTEYFTSTELILLMEPEPIPVDVVDQLDRRPDPIELELSDLFTENASYNFDMEKYENVYVIFRNVITSDRETNGQFKINDGNGNSAFIYNQSRYFKAGSAGEVGWEAPNDGTYLSYVRGILTTRTNGYYLVPVYPGDVGDVLVSPPTISSVRRNVVEVGFNQPVEVSAKITDFDGDVTEAKILYSVNGGERDSAVMTSSDSIFVGTIPGLSDSSIVDFYIAAKDDQGNQSVFPSNQSSNFFYLVLDRPLTIQDVQYSPFGSGFSGYHNYHVTVTGVVTSDTSGASNRTGTVSNRIIIQNGQGPWSGIWLNTLNNSSGTSTTSLALGNEVTVTGLVTEDFNVTKLDSISSIIINNTNAAVPEPEVLQTGDIGTKPGGTIEAEQWESVLVSFENVTVTDINADGDPGPDGSTTGRNHGEMFISDGSGNVRVELQEGNHYYHNVWAESFPVEDAIEIKDSSTFDKISGYLYFSFSFYKLVPRYQTDFVGYQDPVAVEDELEVPAQYSLNQNYPNPFNPATVISYSIPKSGNVVLKIYNLLGQEVKTLVNQFQNAGRHQVTFDASLLTSGVYFYRIQAENFTQVKKMMLIK